MLGTKKALLRTLALLACAVTAACASGYRESFTSASMPFGLFEGGFSETQLAENVFTVRFNGNASTSAERATDFTLLRSAEVAIEHGFRFFAVTDSDEEMRTRTNTTPVYGTTTDSNGRVHPTVTGSQTHTFTKPSSQNTIVCFREKPTDRPMVFEAEFVKQSIREKWEIESD